MTVYTPGREDVGEHIWGTDVDYQQINSILGNDVDGFVVVGSCVSLSTEIHKRINILMGFEFVSQSYISCFSSAEVLSGKLLENEEELEE